MKRPRPFPPWAFALLLLLSVALCAHYRLPLLDSRPMHTDEAILADKLATLWNGGGFQYDPTDYHGPALHDFTRAAGWLAGWGDPDSWTEARLRRTVALTGMALMLLTLLLLDALGKRAALVAMLLTAVSPMMVFYSRYFIMEMLLALTMFIAIISLWRWSLSERLGWLVLCGAALGVAHATKETFVINVAAGLAAWPLAARWARARRHTGMLLLAGRPRKSTSPWPPFITVALSALAVSVLIYSRGLRDWTAVQESFTTYLSYLNRSTGSGHEKPWHYYLTLIFWRKDGLVWSEALIGGLGVAGMVQAFLSTQLDTARRRFQIFLSIYTVLLFAVYSALAYKTPWTILCAQHSLTLLAGCGAAAIWTSLPRWPSIAFRILLGLGIYHLCAQTMTAIGHYKADPRNPYVYAHTTTNLLKLVETVRDLAELAGPDRITVQVINRDHGWPLPWYFRGIPKAGYYATLPPRLDADVIIAEESLHKQIDHLLPEGAYQDTGLHGLRPGVPLLMKVRTQLWHQLMAQRRAASREPRASGAK